MMSSGTYFPNRDRVVVAMQHIVATQETNISQLGRSITIDQNGQHMTITEELIELLGDLHGRTLRTDDDERHGTAVRRGSQSSP